MCWKKVISIGVILGILASSAGVTYAAEEVHASKTETDDVSATGTAAGEEISPEDISVTWDDSHVFMNLSLGQFKTITTYGVKGYEDVPFISASDYLDILCEGKENITVEDGVMKIALNGTEAVIDPAADTIRFENTAKFMSSNSGVTNAVDGGIVGEEEFNVITISEKNESIQTEAKPLTISLKEYHMPVIPYEDTILMPFLALQNTFGSVRMSNVLAYNGKDYYNAFEADMFITDEEHAEAKDSPYIKAIYSGPFSEREETSQAYADYGYYAVCLLLDLTYGHKEERNITTFDEYFTRINAKGSLCSTDPSSAVTAEFLLFNFLFDSGHDSMVTSTNVFGENANTNVDEPTVDAALGALLEKGLKLPEVAPLLVWTFFIDGNKPEDYGSERLNFAGDTAVIYFDAFKDNTTERDPSYYLDPITEEDEAESTFAFFHECFEKIKQHEEVKNVVINLSANGGGNATALVAVLGFLSDDGEVVITSQDMMAGNYRKECYHVDTNLDGIADDQDGFGGEYDFYIMCSGSSYSCANAMPYFAQQDGLAAIIGARPGGGDCVVGSFVDAYGRCACYSGMLKLGEDDGNGFVSNEKATTLDLNMMPSITDIKNVPWFDPEGIADAVHQYQNGATEIKYNDLTEEEKMTQFLQGLFEQVKENWNTEESSPQQ